MSLRPQGESSRWGHEPYDTSLDRLSDYDYANARREIQDRYGSFTRGRRVASASRSSDATRRVGRYRFRRGHLGHRLTGEPRTICLDTTQPPACTQRTLIRDAIVRPSEGTRATVGNRGIYPSADIHVWFRSRQSRELVVTRREDVRSREGLGKRGRVITPRRTVSREG